MLLCYVVHFGSYDWNYALENQMAATIENMLRERIKEAKKVIVEKN